MIKKLFISLLTMYCLLIGCKHTIKPEMLYGDWKYIKLGNPNSHDPGDTVITTDLNIIKPYITFTKQHKLIMHWADTILAQGKFKIDGDRIYFTQQLVGGKTHTFPFLVSKLDTKTLIFETLGKDGSRVTAIKR